MHVLFFIAEKKENYTEVFMLFSIMWSFWRKNKINFDTFFFIRIYSVRDGESPLIGVKTAFKNKKKSSLNYRNLYGISC